MRKRDSALTVEKDGGHGRVVSARVNAQSHHRHSGLSNDPYTSLDGAVTPMPGAAVAPRDRSRDGAAPPLYTREERLRRDATRWTIVQGVLAPVQFLAFMVSLALVLRYLATGEGLRIAVCSIVIKTLLLYAIMITGSIWEKVVFGRYLFAPAFFWEDVFSILVLALHTVYLAAIAWSIGSPRQQMLLVLAAYASYVINAGQFLLKLRAARLQEAGARVSVHALAADNRA